MADITSVTSEALSDIFRNIKAAKSVRQWNDLALVSVRSKDLSSRFHNYRTSHQFHEGQIVKWKSGLKNKRIPEENEPAIVVHILTNPVVDPAQASDSPYFNEPLNIVLGVLDGDGDFAMWHFDSARFEPYEIA